MLKIVLFLSLILTVQVSSQEIYLPLNQENTITPTPIIDIEVLEEFDDPVMPEYVESIAWSPDGSKIAYSTSDSVLHIEDLQGGKLAEVQGAQGPIWRSNGSVVIFSKVPEGTDVRQLPATSHPASLDLVTRKVELLTDSNFADAPEGFTSSLEQ